MIRPLFFSISSLNIGSDHRRLMGGRILDNPAVRMRRGVKHKHIEDRLARAILGQRLTKNRHQNRLRNGNGGTLVGYEAGRIHRSSHRAKNVLDAQQDQQGDDVLNFNLSLLVRALN